MSETKKMSIYDNPNLRPGLEMSGLTDNPDIVEFFYNLPAEGPLEDIQIFKVLWDVGGPRCS